MKDNDIPREVIDKAVETIKDVAEEKKDSNVV